MKKPRENQDKDYIGEPPEQPLPVSSAPQIQNFKPQIPPEMKNQKRPMKHQVRIRK